MVRLLPLVLSLLLSLPVLAQTITPDQLWSAMLQGNKQFVAGSIKYDNLKQERETLASSQLPPVTVLACSDSRVPPELVFNQSLGGLFVIRTAGNTADEFGIASVEFAIANGWTKLLIVLGHESCGAITASLGTANPATPALTALATRIRTSFTNIPYDSRDKENVRKATDANTRNAAAQLLAHSTVIRDAVATEKIKIVPAYYSLTTGEVKRVD
jgi:carbonic anhydrase